LASPEIQIQYAVPVPSSGTAPPSSIRHVVRVEDQVTLLSTTKKQVCTPGGLELFSGVIQNIQNQTVHFTLETDGGVGPPITVIAGAYITLQNVCLLSLGTDITTLIELIGIVQVYKTQDDYDIAAKMARLDIPATISGVYSNQARPAFYDRNSITGGFFQYGLLTSPTFGVIAGAYTVPSNRKAMLMGASTTLQRLTASTSPTFDLLMIQNITGTSAVCFILMYDNTLFVTRSAHIGQSIQANAADGFRAFVILSSSAANFYFACAFTYTEFDA
jgi:hypothetical protein